MTSLKSSGPIKKKCVMTIAGSDSGGGAGIQADLRTFAALSVHGTCVLASVTAQNTKGVHSVFDIPVSEIGKQIDAVCTDMEISFAKTGMLSSPEIVEFVAEKIKEYNISLIVDPVMAAEAGGELLKKDAVSALSHSLLPVSFAVTPNIFEAEILSGMKIKNMEDAKEAAQIIAKTGVKYVIITGGHSDAEDLAYDSENKKFTHFKGEFVKGGTHGTGCTYSAALVSYLARSHTFDQACRLAKSFVVNAILYSKSIGDGVAPVNPAGAAILKAERANVIENILAAREILKTDNKFPHLIPNAGTDIAMTLPDIFQEAASGGNYASEILPSEQIRMMNYPAGLRNIESFGSAQSYTAVLPLRIHKMKNKTGTKRTAKSIGYPSFSSGSDLEKVIRSAQLFDKTICACIYLKYAEKIIKASEQTTFSICVFYRSDEPKGFDETLEWGTYDAIQRNGGVVPDIVYETGGHGKEDVIRVFGTDAVDAAEKILKICGKIADKSKKK